MERDPPPPYEDPPSYESVVGGLCHVTTTAAGLTVVDFLPESVNIHFPVLISRANEWLRCNPYWEAKTCESVEFKTKVGIPKVNCVTFLERFYGTSYVRGLRLWLTLRANPNQSPQQINFFNAVPKQVGTNLSGPQFERFDGVMTELNSKLSQNPIPGRIINVETQPMKFSLSQRVVEPDRSYYTDNGFSVFVIRVFYEVGPTLHETIGVIDFFPKQLGCHGSFGEKYESIPSLVGLVASWYSQQQNIRLCNLQSVPMTMKPEVSNRVDNMKMSIREDRNQDHRIKYLRVLRVFYVRTSTSNPETPTEGTLLNPITCKTFLPVQLTDGDLQVPTFETTQQTLTRISEWVRQHHVQIISAETFPVKMYISREEREGPDTTYFCKDSDSERFIFVFRLYLCGHYPDPPVSMCPAAYRGWFSRPVGDAENIPPPPQECCIS